MKARYFQLKPLVITAIAGVLVLSPFQNCAFNPVGGSVAGQVVPGSEGSKGNGDGYTGKVEGTYVNIDTSGVCAEKSVIEVKDGKATLTKEACQTVAATDVTQSTEVKDFNPEVLFHNDRLYERVESGKAKIFSSLVCRGIATTETQGQTPFADISLTDSGTTVTPPPAIYPGPAKVFTGYVKVGTYAQNGSLLSSEESPVNRAVQYIRDQQIDYMIDHGDQSGGPKPPADRDLADSPYQLQTKDSLGRLRFGSAELDRFLVVDKMNCYHH